MSITVYNIQRNGNASEVRFVKSTITNSRLIVVKDDINKKMYVFYGAQIHPETKRLGGYTIDDMNKSNYELIEVSKSDWKDKKNYLFELSRNPKLVEAKGKVEVIKPKKKEIKEKVAEKIDDKVIERVDDKKEATKFGMAKTQKEIEIIRQKIKDEASEAEKIEAKKNIAKVGHAPVAPTIEIKPKKKLSSIPQTKIPMPPETLNTPSELDNQFMLKGDISEGNDLMIDQFQISYYDRSGGSNYILIQELSDKIDGSQFDQIRELVNSINELCDRDSTQLTAQKILTKQLDKMIKIVFRN